MNKAAAQGTAVSPAVVETTVHENLIGPGCVQEPPRGCGDIHQTVRIGRPGDLATAIDLPLCADGNWIGRALDVDGRAMAKRN